MTVLCDWEIKNLCEAGMIEGYAQDLINPASLDVRLGGRLMIEVADTKDFVNVDISHRTSKNPYRLMPGEFCLAETEEIFHIPDTLSAQFVLKSSRAREGYENLLAGWIDPGFGLSKGSRLTLELVNARRHWDLPLYPGMKIGQIVFFKMSSIPINSYSKVGRYNGDLRVNASKG
jgi:dCTP deaminase